MKELTLFNSLKSKRFGKSYQNQKAIGKGTFAKVILSTRIADKKEFAIKTFDKKTILSAKNTYRTLVLILDVISFKAYKFTMLDLTGGIVK